MSKVTLCPSLMELCAQDPRYLVDVLYSLIRGPRRFKITVDDARIIFEEYRALGKQHRAIYEWLDVAAKVLGGSGFVRIPVGEFSGSGKALYLFVHQGAVGEKALLCLEPQLYAEYDLKGVKILDKDDSVEYLANPPRETSEAAQHIHIEGVSGSALIVGSNLRDFNGVLGGGNDG
jgi:hypothetical protein